MKIKLLEKPSIFYRDNAAIVVFPSKPYWFSATQEIGAILSAFELGQVAVVVEKISVDLDIDIAEAEEICNEMINMLHSSGVLAFDGRFSKIAEFSPDFQVNDVENVLVIATTQQCNMSCPMCYAMASKKMNNEMSTEEIKGIIYQLSKMPWQSTISRVALTGGELFMRSDAIDLIEYVHRQGFFAQVNTNATLLTDEHIKRLAEFKRLKMSISLDGCKRESHELIRGEGTFELTLQNIKALCDRGVSMAINMFVHGGNLNEIEGTIRLADSLGVVGFNCLNMMNVGRGNSTRTKQALECVPLAVFYRNLFNILRNDERLQKLMVGSTFANQLMGIAGGVKSHGCGIGTNRAVYVKADGSLYPCADTALPAFRLGNLRTENLADIWSHSPILKELRCLDVDSMNPTCASCDVRYMCGGNCRGENYQTTKDIRSPHFKCVEIRDSILELMWILTEDPDLFKCKVENLHAAVSSHATSA